MRSVILRLLCMLIGRVSADLDALDSSEPFFMEGLRAYEAGNLQVAHDAFARCLSLKATRTDCMTNLGSVLVDLGNLQAAEELSSLRQLTEWTQGPVVRHMKAWPLLNGTDCAGLCERRDSWF